MTVGRNSPTESVNQLLGALNPLSSIWDTREDFSTPNFRSMSFRPLECRVLRQLLKSSYRLIEVPERNRMVSLSAGALGSVERLCHGERAVDPSWKTFGENYDVALPRSLTG